ncbi:MAG: hypothetical protein ACRD0K_28225 [Egibacteraceae bacterium]
MVYPLMPQTVLERFKRRQQPERCDRTAPLLAPTVLLEAGDERTDDGNAAGETGNGGTDDGDAAKDRAGECW